MITDGTPLYIQVRNKIQEGITNGDISPDSNGLLPGQHYFAEVYNVGLMTVKRAIKDLEQMGLVESRRGKGLILKSVTPVPNSVPEITDGTIRIGVVFFDIFKSMVNPVVARLVNGIERYAGTNRIALHIVSFPGLEIELQERSLFSDVPLTNLNGVLLLSPISPMSLAKLAQLQLPFVSLNLLSDEKAICHGMDMVSAAFQITDAILKRGAKDIILFAGNMNKLGGYMRLSGYRMALAKHGLEVDPSHVIDEDYNIEASIEFIEGFIAEGRKVDAVEAYDDRMAAGIRDYLASTGRRDVVVAGVGNLEAYSDKVDITVDPHFEEIGYNLIEMLVDTIHGKVPKRTKYYYEPLLIERDIH